MKTMLRVVFGVCVWIVLDDVCADIAPPPDYVEKCVLKKQQGRSEQCQVCGASFQGRDACLELGDQGYTHRCSTYGASVWSEIWCKSSRPQDAAKPDR